VTPQIENHFNANGNMRKRTIMLNNFLGGLAWGFGTVVGATLVVAIIYSALKSTVPGFNEFMHSFQSPLQIQETKQ
jgi:hypothetical protein